MASDETMTVNSSLQEDDETDDGLDHVFDHRLRGLSRLSVCTTEDDDYGDRDDQLKNYLSRLSIESFDADADAEFSDEKEGKEFLGAEMEISSDSDKDNPTGFGSGCYSLPATPTRRRNRNLAREIFGVEKDYSSENEVLGRKLGKNLRRGRREKLGENNKVGGGNFGGSYSGESEGGGSSGVVVITRPRGGSRSLCMDLDEVKACRDLGFELEHERMLEIPTRTSTFDNSSGSNSPIPNWRISSPGKLKILVIL